LIAQGTFQNGQDKSIAVSGLAYYTVFSLAPLLIIVIAIAGSVAKKRQGRNVGQIQGLVGKDGAVIETAIENANKPDTGSIASIIIIVLLFGASGIFAELQDALNTVWEVQPKPERGLINVIRSRFFVVLDGARRWLLLLVPRHQRCFSGDGQLVTCYHQVSIFSGGKLYFAFGVTTVLFGLIYKCCQMSKLAGMFGLELLLPHYYSLGRYLLGSI